MLKKSAIGKGVSMVLVISMFGMGAPSLPSVFADDPPAQTAPAITTNVLSNLELGGITFDQGTFSPSILNYTATVENSVTSVTLLAISDITNAKITVTINGQTVNDTTQPILLQTGVNQIAIKVDDSVNPANTYNLTITRKKSSNDLLKDLQLSSGGKSLLSGFDTNSPNYIVHVDNDVSNVTVTPVAADSTATVAVSVNGTSVTNDTVQLPTGTNAITEIAILVTAENGDQKTYTINVTKKPVPPKTSSNPSNRGTSPSSSKGSSNSASGLTGLKNASQSFGAASNRSSASFTSASGSGSGSYGSQQGAAAVQPSKATLSGLTVSAGTWNKTFAKDTYTYHIAEGSDVNSVTLSDSTTYSDSAVTIQDGSNVVNLGNQAKTIVPIVVTNGSDQKTYVLVFDKTVPPAPATTAATQTTTTDNTASDTSFNNSGNGNGGSNWGGGNNWSGNTNNTSTSFWGRLLDSVRSFFSKL